MNLLILWNVIFNNVEENENVLEVRRIREQHRISHFYENVILNYSLTDFKSHFRVTRETFELLIQHIEPALLQRDNCPKILPAKQIAIALWIFGNQEVTDLLQINLGYAKIVYGSVYLMWLTYCKKTRCKLHKMVTTL